METRSELEFFYRPENPVQLSDISLKVLPGDFDQFTSVDDKEKIANFWKRKLETHPGSKTEKDLATMYNLRVEDPSLGGKPSAEFLVTEYMVYNCIANTGIEDHKKRLLSSQAHDKMRVAAVGVALRTSDDRVLVHMRSNEAHSAGIMDSSCAGLMHIYDGSLDLLKDIQEKYTRELGISPEEIKVLGVTDIHSSEVREFSGMFSLSAETPLSSKELSDRIPSLKKGGFKSYEFVPHENLGKHVIEKYTEGERPMYGDGVAVLLSSLGVGEADKYIKQIQNRGRSITESRLVKTGSYANRPTQKTEIDY